MLVLCCVVLLVCGIVLRCVALRYAVLFVFMCVCICACVCVYACFFLVLVLCCVVLLLRRVGLPKLMGKSSGGGPGRVGEGSWGPGGGMAMTHIRYKPNLTG